MEKKEQKDYGKLVKILQIATGILMIALVVVGIIVKQKLGISAKNIPLLSQQLTEQFGNGVLILSVIMIAISVVKSFALILPPAVVYSITAYILDPGPKGFVISLIVNTVACVLSLIIPYWLGRFTGAGMVDTLSKKFKAIKKLDDFAGTNEMKLTAVIKFAGILPGDLSSLLFGAMNISFKNYMIGAFIGNFPLVAAYTLFGLLLKSVGDKPWVVAIPVAIIVVFLLIASLITKKMISDNKKNQPEQTK